jgi:predicted permease
VPLQAAAVGVALLLLPDFLLIAGGAALRRMPGFGAPFWSGVERLVYYVLFPALLFRALATSPLGPGDAGRLTAIGVGFTVAGMALSLAAGPLFRLPRATFASCFQCAFRFNTYVALAVGSRLGGEAGVAAISLMIGVLVPLVNFAAVMMLARGRDTHVGVELAKNPLVVACVAGIGWKLAGGPMPELPARVLGHLASAALPLGLLAVGAGLRLAHGTLPLPALAWWNGIKLVALPACALVLADALGATALERQIAVGMAAVPTATSAYILATQMDGDGPSVAALISSGTLLAALTLPLWLAMVA